MHDNLAYRSICTPLRIPWRPAKILRECGAPEVVGPSNDQSKFGPANSLAIRSFCFTVATDLLYVAIRFCAAFSKYVSK